VVSQKDNKVSIISLLNSKHSLQSDRPHSVTAATFKKILEPTDEERKGSIPTDILRTNSFTKTLALSNATAQETKKDYDYIAVLLPPATIHSNSDEVLSSLSPQCIFNLTFNTTL